MKQLLQKRTAGGQVFPSPRADEIIYENPPTFCFLYEGGAESYTVSVRRQGETFWQGTTSRNFITPDKQFESGDYEWNLTTLDAERGWQSFSIAENAVDFPRPDAKTIFDSVPEVRPRHLFFSDEIQTLLDTHPNAVATLRRNIALALQDGLPKPPRYHRDPAALPYREYFGRYRDFCDRDLLLTQRNCCSPCATGTARGPVLWKDPGATKSV